MCEWRLTRREGEYCVTWDALGEDGRKHRHRWRLGTTDTREAEARAAARYAQHTRPVGKSVATLWAGYQIDKAGKAVLETMVHTWKALKPVFGHLDGDKIGTEDCRSYTKMRREAGKSDGTIHTELGHLRMILLWGHGMKMISEAPAIERRQKPDPKDRYLLKSEVKKMIELAKSPHIKTAILLMISTGARVSAALDLTWDRVDFERGIIRLHNPFDRTVRKTRATVPMNDGLKAELEKVKRGAMTNYIVEYGGAKVASIRKGIALTAEAAQLEDVSPHVFRHSAAVWLVEDGHSFEEVAQFLGHSDPRVTYKIYGRFSPTHLRKLANSLDLD